MAPESKPKKRKKYRYALISGSGFSDHLGLRKGGTITTEYGEAEFGVLPVGGEEIAVLKRHGKNHSLPPHRINHKANIEALHRLGVERIISTSAVGIISKKIDLRDFVIVDDFIDFTQAGLTYYDSGAVHVDMTHPFCPEIKSILKDAAKDKTMPVKYGVYVVTAGPRLETPAEIKSFSRLGGDVVGMTIGSEAVLAREKEMCYSAIAIPTNYAAGLQSKLSAEEIIREMESKSPLLKEWILSAVKRIPEKRNCKCGCALDEAKL